MNIFITNDDGFDAPGMRALISALVAMHKYNIYVVAPHEHMSAKGHSITLGEVNFVKDEIDGTIAAYRLMGTPVDCVKYAMNLIFPDVKFDLCLSGINNGANTDVDLHYSGTFSAAHEASTFGIDSMALSMSNWESREYTEADFLHAARHIADFLEDIPIVRKPFLYNINYPENIEELDFRVAICLDERDWGSAPTIEKMGNGFRYMNILPNTTKGGSELNYLLKGKPTIVPIKVDFNDYENIIPLRDMISKIKEQKQKNY